MWDLKESSGGGMGRGREWGWYTAVDGGLHLRSTEGRVLTESRIWREGLRTKYGEEEKGITMCGEHDWVLSGAFRKGWKLEQDMVSTK